MELPAGPDGNTIDRLSTTTSHTFTSSTCWPRLSFPVYRFTVALVSKVEVSTISNISYALPNAVSTTTALDTPGMKEAASNLCSARSKIASISWVVSETFPVQANATAKMTASVATSPPGTSQPSRRHRHLLEYRPSGRSSQTAETLRPDGRAQAPGPNLTPWVDPYPAHRRIPVAKTPITALAYDSAPYWSRPEVGIEIQVQPGRSTFV